MAVERDEFEGWMRTLREDIRASREAARQDTKGVHDRLDELNGRTRKLENQVAVLDAAEKQMPALVAAAVEQTPKNKDLAARWAALGAGLAGLLGSLFKS